MKKAMKQRGTEFWKRNHFALRVLESSASSIPKSLCLCVSVVSDFLSPSAPVLKLPLREPISSLKRNTVPPV
jgi:hypothetical protein